MLFELEWVKSASDHSLIFLLLSPKFTTFAEPFDHLANVDNCEHSQEIDIVVTNIKESFLKDSAFALLILNDREKGLLIRKNLHK